MSVKSTVITNIQGVLDTYTEGMKKVRVIFRDQNLSIYGKNEKAAGVLDDICKRVDANTEKVNSLLGDVAAFYDERDAQAAAKKANDANYQMVFSAALNQLPAIMKCSEQIQRARFSAFSNDPIAREALIEKRVSLDVLPECTVGRSAEMAKAVQKRVYERLIGVKGDARNEIDRLRDTAKYDETLSFSVDIPKPEDGTMWVLKSFIAYLEGLNGDCSDFDPAKVDPKAAGWEIMSSHDFAGAIAKRYGGRDMSDVIEEVKKAALAEHFAGPIVPTSGGGGNYYRVEGTVSEGSEESSTEEAGTETETEGETESTGTENGTEGTETESTGTETEGSTEEASTGTETE